MKMPTRYYKKKRKASKTGFVKGIKIFLKKKEQKVKVLPMITIK